MEVSARIVVYINHQRWYLAFNTSQQIKKSSKLWNAPLRFTAIICQIIMVISYPVISPMQLVNKSWRALAIHDFGYILRVHVRVFKKIIGSSPLIEGNVVVGISSYNQASTSSLLQWIYLQTCTGT